MGEGDPGDLVKVESSELATAQPQAEIDHLQAEIEAARARFRDSLEGLQNEVEEATDWKGWIVEHPWETVGVAFALGFLLGSG